MSNSQKLLLIYIFQIIPLLINPPEPLKSGWAFVAIMVLIFFGLGFGLWRGHNWVLSLSLTMQGFNVIIRLLMFYPKAILVLSDEVSCLMYPILHGVLRPLPFPGFSYFTWIVPT